MLKTQHSKMKNMASSPIISWQTDGGKMETVTDFIWGAPNSMKLKDACSFEEKL